LLARETDLQPSRLRRWQAGRSGKVTALAMGRPGFAPARPIAITWSFQATGEV